MPGTSRPALRTSTSVVGSTVVVALDGELDLATAAGLRTRLAEVVNARPAPAVVVLDLSELGFVDATGISVLISAQRKLAARGGMLCVRTPSRTARRLIRLLDLEKALPIES